MAGDRKAPRLLFDEQRIAERVHELAREISAEFTAADPLIVVGVLKGAFIFLADLVRRLEVPSRIDFVTVSSYGAGTEAGELRVLGDLREDVAGRNVLIVDDIADRGRTMELVRERLATCSPESVRTCVLVRKRREGVVPPQVDYVGFDVSDVWIVGYGLDLAEDYRELAYIGSVDPESAPQDSSV